MSSSLTTGPTDGASGAPPRADVPSALMVSGGASVDQSTLFQAVAAERARGDRRFTELKRQAQSAIAERDAAIDQLRRHIRKKSDEIARQNARVGGGWLSGLSPEESRAREQYELGRLGSAKLWVLLMVRSLPVMPLLSLLACLILNMDGATSVQSPGKLFLVTSIVSPALVGLGAAFGIVLLWRELGPRWIWLRSVDMRARAFEALTSAGEGLTLTPEDVTLETSPLLSLLGIGVIRRCDTARKFVTSEPGSWLAAPIKPHVRRRWVIDLLTVLALAGWVAAGVWWA